MQALAASVQQTVGSVYLMLTKGGGETGAQADVESGHLRICHKYQKCSEPVCKLLILWWAQQDSNLRLPPCEGVVETAGCTF